MLKVAEIDIFEDCDVCGKVKELKYKIITDYYAYEMCESCRLKLLEELIRV